MRVSTKGRYALRLMTDLAMHDAEGPVRIKDVAARTVISMKYLEQIIGGLSKAGYVSSTRGPAGGYRLTMEPKDYTVEMILQVAEGSMAPVSCLDPGVDRCENWEACTTLRLWREIDEAVSSVTRKYTLEDLVSWHQEVTEK